MADTKKDAGPSEGTKLVEKALQWVLIIGVLFALLKWITTPTVIVQGGNPNDTAAATIPVTQQTTPQFPRAPTGTSWTNHGQNNLCVGRPKFTTFDCVNPRTGVPATCVCD